MNEKDIFIQKIEGRPDILQKLSLDRLEILNNYYDELIKKNKKVIKRLKNYK